VYSKCHMTNIIVAYDQRRAIGAHGDLPWGRSLPGDLALFRRLTLGSSVVMGRTTFESIGRPLPDRQNIVVSRNPELDIPGVICVTSLAHALERASFQTFVIGGSQLYRHALPKAHAVYATEIHDTFSEADTFFPELPDTEWAEAERISDAQTPNDAYRYDVVRYERFTES
jgi:dihydrofolate reductase